MLLFLFHKIFCSKNAFFFAICSFLYTFAVKFKWLKVNNKVLFLFSFLLIGYAYVSAQIPVTTPDLQTADSYFFDPTREVKVKEKYAFGVEWRLEAGYAQVQERTKNDSYLDQYLHGGQVGVLVDFLLPVHFSIQTGVIYQFSFATRNPHYRSMLSATTTPEFVKHTSTQHALVIPVRAYYTQKLAKKWRMLFYGGPQMMVTLAYPDKVSHTLSDETCAWLSEQKVYLNDYDRVADGELYRFTIQLGVGGGFEWDRLRLVAGYDFGLNNIVKNKVTDSQHLWDWGWYVRFGVRVGKDRETIIQEKLNLKAL